MQTPLTFHRARESTVEEQGFPPGLYQKILDTIQALENDIIPDLAKNQKDSALAHDDNEGNSQNTIEGQGCKLESIGWFDLNPFPLDSIRPDLIFALDEWLNSGRGMELDFAYSDKTNEVLVTYLRKITHIKSTLENIYGSQQKKEQQGGGGGSEISHLQLGEYSKDTQSPDIDIDFLLHVSDPDLARMESIEWNWIKDRWVRDESSIPLSCFPPILLRTIKLLINPTKTPASRLTLWVDRLAARRIFLMGLVSTSRSVRVRHRMGWTWKTRWPFSIQNRTARSYGEVR